MASPLHSSRPFRRASCRRPVLAAPITARQMSGSHHGRPSGPTRVNDVSAASAASTARIGNSAAISVGTRGLTSGDERAQRGDPSGDRRLRVEQAAQDAHARRAIENAAVDRPARLLDRQMPGLAAGEQRDDLQQHGRGEHPPRGAGERGRELVAAPGEQQREDRRGGQRAQDRDQRASAAPEVAETRSQFGQLTPAARSRGRADRFASRESHRRLRSTRHRNPRR
jgi:hypothetical protein